MGAGRLTIETLESFRRSHHARSRSLVSPPPTARIRLGGCLRQIVAQRSAVSKRNDRRRLDDHGARGPTGSSGRRPAGSCRANAGACPYQEIHSSVRINLDVKNVLPALGRGTTLLILALARTVPPAADVVRAETSADRSRNPTDLAAQTTGCYAARRSWRWWRPPTCGMATTGQP